VGEEERLFFSNLVTSIQILLWAFFSLSLSLSSQIKKNEIFGTIPTQVGLMTSIQQL
jgi:hypothetical protein